jgi:hypothetical protein
MEEAVPYIKDVEGTPTVLRLSMSCPPPAGRWFSYISDALLTSGLVAYCSRKRSPFPLPRKTSAKRASGSWDRCILLRAWITSFFAVGIAKWSNEDESKSTSLMLATANSTASRQCSSYRTTRFEVTHATAYRLD